VLRALPNIKNVGIVFKTLFMKIVPPFLLLLLLSCEKDNTEDQPNSNTSAYTITKSVSYNNVNVNVIIDKPVGNEFDVLIIYHGTVQSDNNILAAAENTLNQFKNILTRENVMFVSVAHPQLNILFGDNISQAEAALLWVKNKANQELGITVRKIFLAGHSQGGYLVTRLNTMHQTNGVIANAPGPLNLVFRCQLE
jgi:poly(3-hydroxybutyrate) depolymerase